MDKKINLEEVGDIYHGMELVKEGSEICVIENEYVLSQIFMGHDEIP